MKKFYLVLLTLVSLSAASQKIQTKKDQPKTLYVSVNYSIGKQKEVSDPTDKNENQTRMQSFSEVTYPSVEVGYCPDTTSYGFILGRGSFANTYSENPDFDKTKPETPENPRSLKNNELSNYYWEVKISPSKSIGRFTGSVFIGTGSYFNSTHYFGELGAGVSYKINNYNYGVAYSNWDSSWYLTPYISYSF